MSVADYTLESRGDIALLGTTSPRARQWLEAFLTYEKARWRGDILVVDWSYAEGIVLEMRAAGMVRG